MKQLTHFFFGKWDSDFNLILVVSKDSKVSTSKDESADGKMKQRSTEVMGGYRIFNMTQYMITGPYNRKNIYVYRSEKITRDLLIVQAK